MREAIVRKTIDQILQLGHEVDLRICGVGKHAALRPLDLIFAPADPRELVFETIEAMARHVHDYDYFLNLEDDIHVPSSTIENAIAFEEAAGVTDIFHPNRMETGGGQSYCVDLRAMGSWTELRREYNGRVLGVASNRHSGLMFLSREKFMRAIEQVDLSLRGPRCNGDLMASAYWHVHEPFHLWREMDPGSSHVVYHADPWLPDL